MGPQELSQSLFGCFESLEIIILLYVGGASATARLLNCAPTAWAGHCLGPEEVPKHRGDVDGAGHG